MWPLHTSEALAPLLVALAPISIYQICGPCTWPLHLFSWPLHRPLPQENAPFGRLSDPHAIFVNQSQIKFT